jgi:hypothetical protein
MSNIKQTYSFVNSGINSDLDLHVIPSGEATSMINCEVGDYGGIGVLEKSKGNVELDLGIRVNDKIIGVFYSLLHESLFIFIYNSQNEHCILQYNPETKVKDYVIQDNEYLDFSEDDIVKDVEYIGDLMIFTTGRGSIKNINIQEAIAYYKGEYSTYASIGLNEININKPKPLINILNITYLSNFKDDYNKSSHFKGEKIRAIIAVVCVYADGSESDISEFSKVVSLGDVNLSNNYAADYAVLTYRSSESIDRVKFIIKKVDGVDMYLLKDAKVEKETINNKVYFNAEAIFESIPSIIYNTNNVVTGVKENVKNIAIVSNRLVICDYNMQEAFDDDMPITISNPNYNEHIGIEPCNLKLNRKYAPSSIGQTYYASANQYLFPNHTNPIFNEFITNTIKSIDITSESDGSLGDDVFVKIIPYFNAQGDLNNIKDDEYSDILVNSNPDSQLKYLPINKYPIYFSINDNKLYDIPKEYIYIDDDLPYITNIATYLKSVYRDKYKKDYNGENVSVTFWRISSTYSKGINFYRKYLVQNPDNYVITSYEFNDLVYGNGIPNYRTLNGLTIGQWPTVNYESYDITNPLTFEGFLYFENYVFYINLFTKSGIYVGSKLIGSSKFEEDYKGNNIQNNLNTYINKSVEFKILKNNSELLYSIGYTIKERYDLNAFRAYGLLGSSEIPLRIDNRTFDKDKPVFIRIFSLEFAGLQYGHDTIYRHIEQPCYIMRITNDEVVIANPISYNNLNARYLKHNDIGNSGDFPFPEGEVQYGGLNSTYNVYGTESLWEGSSSINGTYYMTGVIYNKTNIETNPDIVKVCSELKPLATDSDIYLTPEYGAYIFKNYYKYIGGTVSIEVQQSSKITSGTYNVFFNNGSCGLSTFTELESLSKGRLAIPLIDDTVNSDDIYKRLLNNKNNIFWSDVYIPKTKVNGLNKFDYTDTKSLDISYGDIVKIVTTANSLKVIQWHKVSNIFEGRNEMVNTDSNINLVATDNILGSKTEYLENLGSKYTHSVVSNGNNIYGVDSIAYSIWKVTGNGIERLERYGINKLLKDIIKSAIIFDIVSGYDSNKNLLYVTFIFTDGTYRTLQFNDQTKKWKEFTFKPTMYVYGGNTLFTTFGAYIYEHGKGYKFYGEDYEASINIIANQNPNIVKTFDTMSVASNKVVDIKNIELPKNERYIKGMKSRLPKSQFKNIEGKYHAAFLRNSIQTSNIENNKDLFNGDKLRGEYANIKITLDDDTKVFSVEVNMTGSLPI